LLARNTLFIKSLNIKRERNQQKLKEEEDMIPNKKDLEDKRNLFSERRQRLQRKLFLDWNAQYAKERVYMQLKDARPSSLEVQDSPRTQHFK
jgi:hypothetical protein